MESLSLILFCTLALEIGGPHVSFARLARPSPPIHSIIIIIIIIITTYHHSSYLNHHNHDHHYISSKNITTILTTTFYLLSLLHDSSSSFNPLDRREQSLIQTRVDCSRVLHLSSVRVWVFVPHSARAFAIPYSYQIHAGGHLHYVYP